MNFPEFQADAPGFLFSTKGNVIGGILGAVVLAGLKYWEKEKSKLPKPKIEETLVYPSDRIGDITLIAAFTGILGAKFFAIFEDMSNLTMDNFFHALFSGGGLAIYGGLIGGFLGVVWYLKKHKIDTYHVADAVAPALIIGYGVGRIGCQLSGDGDWGIVNELAQPSWWFLPEWLWSYDYPQNVLNQGIPIEGCEGIYCRALAKGVFPTPIYELVMAFAIAGILWALRKRLPVPGMLFCPPVGCVIVHKGKIISRGYTNEQGNHHAEAMALEKIRGKYYENLTMFVTLEPCSFYGKTPSCAKSIAKSTIKEVYVGILDPHPKNQGAGIKILEQAGVKVMVGILEEQVHKELDDFLLLK